MIEVTSLFTFGKYKGELVQDVINKDACYVEWCINNVDGFVMSKEDDARIRRLANIERAEEEREYNHERYDDFDFGSLEI